MPLTLRIESELDERSARESASRAERIYTDAARNMSSALGDGLTRGAREGGQAVERMADQARDSYGRVSAAQDELRQQERLLKEMREEGARGVEVQAERVRRARRAEKDAIKEAAAAYDDYERAARGAGDAGEEAGNSMLAGLRGAAGGAASAGQEFASGFAGGFAGAGALTKMAGLAIPGMGWVAAGVTAGTLLVNGVMQGMESLQTRDFFRARLGVDDATMSEYGKAAARAFNNGWGESTADNLATLQFGIQGGLIDRDATAEDVQFLIEQMDTVSQVVGEDAQQIARGTRNLISTGLAGSSDEAFDLIVAASQRGLNLSGDLLDTFEEYGTKFRDLGITGAEALGLVNQMWEGGARNVDVAADGLKEFAINVTDGSELTNQAFEALGFNADQMRSRFIEGGAVARESLGEVLTALQQLDAEEREQVGLALFKTKWEDMGDAVQAANLDTAATQLGNIDGATRDATGTLSQHVDQWRLLRREIGDTFGDLQRWLADSAIGRFFGQDLPNFLSIPFTDYPMPGNGTSYVNPDAAPPVPMNPLDIIAGTGSPGAATGGPGSLLLPSLTGPTPPPGEAAPPADRQTPVPMPDEGDEAAAGGGSESLPSAPVLPLQYSSVAGLPTAVANATTRLDEANHDVAEKEARVNQLRASNVADADDIQNAENALAQAEQRRQQAARALTEAQINTAEQQTKQLEQVSGAVEDFGAGLDSDFGISDGLAGIADNLVRFVGALALAGPMAMLNNISAANPNQGSGMLGMLASSGAFGPEYMPGYQGGGYSPSAMGPAALRPSYGGGSGVYAGDAALLANVPAGRYTQEARGDLTQGLADCSSAVEDLVNLLDGRPTGGASMWTGNAAEWLTERGFLRGLGGPGDFRVGFNSGHMQATLPGGTPFNWGSDASAARGGVGGTGAYDPAFTDHYYRPAGATSPGYAPTTAPSGGSSGGWAGPGIPTGVTGGVGQSPVFGATPTGPGIGAGVGTAPAFGGGTYGGGGTAYPAVGGEGGLGVSGMAMDAAMAGTSALDFMAPGAGAAAKVGIQLMNLSLKQAGKIAGIGVSGVMETLSVGDNPMGSIGNSWFGKLAGGLAGAKPALPNKAGGAPPGGDPSKQPGGPAGAAQQAALKAGNTANITINNQGATPDQNGKDVAAHTAAMWAPSGRQ